jgi:hypothetical protein
MEDELRHPFEPEQLVWLDKDKPNRSQVEVVSQTPQKLYTTVTGDGVYEWTVMTVRLTSI